MCGGASGASDSSWKFSRFETKTKCLDMIGTPALALVSPVGSYIVFLNEHADDPEFGGLNRVGMCRMDIASGL